MADTRKEYSTFYDDLLDGFAKEGKDHSFAHVETLYARLVDFIITYHDVVSVTVTFTLIYFQQAESTQVNLSP